MRFSVIAAMVLAAAGTAAALSAQPIQTRPPNIIYILADDLGYGELGSYGQTKIRTPHLDRMAVEGMRFTQHYSSSPVCAPARASFLTGLHTGHSIVRDNLELGGFLDSEERGQMPLPKGTRTLPSLLKVGGYHTALIGKWGLGGPNTEGQPTRHGFDHFLGYLDQKQAHNFYPTHLWRGEEWFPLRNPYVSPHQKHVGDPNDPASYARYAGTDYSLDVMADDALRYIRQQKDRPFFLYLPFTVPHLALQVPDDSLKEYDGVFDEKPYLGQDGYLPHPRPYSAYAAMITRMDRHIGRISALLKDLGLDDDTLVVFTSDNGATFPTGGADPAFFRSVGNLRGLKGSVYEGGIRVPFIARWPGRIAAGQVTDHLSAMWDMFPTFLELARQPVPSDVDGLSLVPTLLGQSGQRQHASMYWEYHGRWKGAQAVRLGKWKGVRLGGHDNADASIEVYDIDADRSESRNVAAAHPDVVSRVRAVMESRTPSAVPHWNFRRHAAIESQTLATAGDGSPFYRIPALTTTLKGTLLAAYDARPTLADLPGALSIVMRRSTDGGRTWRPQTLVRKGPAPEGYGDPSFIVDRVTGRIFLFHAASVRQGFFGARPGNRDDDPDVLHADYAFSDDDGVTWQFRRITSAIKRPEWGGVFAASGEGIQVRTGPHAGRLIQPYVIRIDGRNWVASAYSDNHGDRWQMGALVGPDADESKAVELSDGRLMLTVRARPMRKVAWSSDGGVTWTGLRDEPALPDPANNGSVMRIYPDAPAGSPEARQLLLTHTSHPSRREHLVVRASCDDGQTWSTPNVVEAGAASYSTLTRLPDGRVGVLYERGAVSEIIFASFDLAWVNGGRPASGLCQPAAGPRASLAVEPATADARRDAWAHHQQMARESPVADLAWRAVGPRLQGGRIETVAVAPGRTSTIYAGAGIGGVWKSINNGTTWTPIFDKEATTSIGSIAVAPSDPNVVWVGTGEVLMARSSYAGFGVYKSTDAGATWTNMGLTDSHHISQVLIHPEDPNRVWVAAIGRLYSESEERGVFRTSDGGKTWQRTLYVNARTGAIDLALDPSNPDVLYASMWDRSRKAWGHVPTGPGSGAYKSTDGGATWTLLGNGLPSGANVGRIGLAIARSNPKVVYALVDNYAPAEAGGRGRGGGQAPDRIGGEVYRSDDAGGSWRKVNTEPVATGWDFCLIQVAPDNENVVYLPNNRFMASENGGRTYRQIQGTLVHLLPHGSTVLHLDQHDLWINPANGDHMLLGNDGGLHLSYDRGASWLHLNNIPIGEFYAVSVDMDTPYNIYGGTQDNAALFGTSKQTLADDRGDQWTHVYLDQWGGGDSYFTYRDPSDKDVYYYEHQFGELRRKRMSTGRTESIAPKAPRGQPEYRTNWMTPFFFSAHNPRTMYYATERLFKSPDRGDTWTAVSPDLTSAPPAQGNVPWGTLTSVSESPLRSTLLYTGADDGRLHVTRDGGTTWTRIGESLPERWISRVVASRHDEATVYVTLTGYRYNEFAAHIYVSRDYGQTWTSLRGNLPAEPINVVGEDPTDARILYVGTDSGVYASVDRGVTWMSLRGNLPTIPVHDLVVHPRESDLVIATHGRSIYIADISAVRARR